jgi:hypothetical protein
MQHLDSDIRRCGALEIMNTVYVCMTCKNSTVICIALAATLGLQLRIPVTPQPHPPLRFPLIVGGQIEQSLWYCKVGLQDVKDLPQFRKQLRSCDVHSQHSANTHAECASVHTTAYRNTIQPEVDFTHFCIVTPVR